MNLKIKKKLCYFYKICLSCSGVVVKGFDMSVASMKKGEKSVFTIRPEKAVGDSKNPPNIPPNSSVIFEVNCYHKNITK